MPTSIVEWTCLLGISGVVGVLVGALARRLTTVIVAVVILQVVTAPFVYYLAPALEHGPTPEYRTWQFLIIPMIAIQSAVLSFLTAFVVLSFRRAVQRRRENL